LYIAYYDEAGDDGYPKYSSPLFVLSAVYLHYSCWKDVFENIRQFRKMLKKDYNIPKIHRGQIFIIDNNRKYRERFSV